MNEQLITYGLVALTLIGVLATVVSIVTQVIKNIGKLKKIATNIVVVVLSILFTIIITIAYLQYTNVPILWFYIVGAIIAGFIVALIAMSGWQAVFDIWNRTKFNKDMITDVVNIPYQIWRDKGHEGDENDFLDWLKKMCDNTI